ncbi:MAG: hypothetical protein DRP08_08150, partial [Candidatus Aenigmatarchaeota archaeon]
MAKTFEILKKRWMEVAVIIAIAMIPQILFSIKALIKSPMSFSYLYTSLMIITTVILTIVRAGFLRTAYLHGTQSYRIGALFGEGKRFFWRLFVFLIILTVIYGLFQMFITFIMTRCIAEDNYLMIFRWSNTLCTIAVTVALMKPVLLVPALVIVRDISLIDAVKSIREYKLFSAKELVTLFGVQQVLRFSYIFLNSLRELAPAF